MSLDINPAVRQDQQLIQAYGDGRFKIAGTAFEGSVIVFREKTIDWHVTLHTDIDAASLAPVIAETADVDILLIGCGPTFQAIPKDLRQALKAHGIIMEWMDTGAASRTFNVLLAEERRVAAALIAVD